MYAIDTGFGASTLKGFFEVRREVYSGDVLSIAEDRRTALRHLLPSRNPWIDPGRSALLVCRKDARPVARLALRQAEDDPSQATFGYFESLDDPEACRTLFSAAASIADRLGWTSIEGPYTPSTNGATGIRLDSFEKPPVFCLPSTPPYYPRLLEGSGLALVKKGRVWSGTAVEVAGALGNDAAGSETKTGSYELKVLDLRDLRSDLRLLSSVIEASFTQNWRFSARHPDQYLFEALDLLPAASKDGVAVVLAGKSPVGVLIVLNDPCSSPDVMRWTARLARRCGVRAGTPTPTAIAFAIAVAPEHRKSRAGLLLKRHFARIVAGRSRVVSTWISTDNTASEEIAAHVGMKPWLTLGVYRWVSEAWRAP